MIQCSLRAHLACASANSSSGSPAPLRQRRLRPLLGTQTLEQYRTSLQLAHVKVPFFAHFRNCPASTCAHGSTSRTNSVLAPPPRTVCRMYASSVISCRSSRSYNAMPCAPFRFSSRSSPMVVPCDVRWTRAMSSVGAGPACAHRAMAVSLESVVDKRDSSASSESRLSTEGVIAWVPDKPVEAGEGRDSSAKAERPARARSTRTSSYSKVSRTTHYFSFPKLQ
jgi:hypothetical protein